MKTKSLWKIRENGLHKGDEDQISSKNSFIENAISSINPNYLGILKNLN